MYISSSIATSDLQIITSKMDEWLGIGEPLKALFPCIRLRSGMAVLAITDRRVLALGQKMLSGWTILQSISSTDIVDTRVLLDGLKEGRVEIDTADGVVVLGAIRTKTKEEIPSAGIYLKALSGTGSSASLPPKSILEQDLLGDDESQVRRADSQDRHLADDSPARQAAGQERLLLDEEQVQRAEKLNYLLNELAAHHRNGVLSDEEFARAKAAILVGPQT